MRRAAYGIFLFLTLCVPAFGAGLAPHPKVLNPNQLAVLSSHFAPSPSRQPPTVWAILQANISRDRGGIGGFSATAWVLASDKRYVFFVTAAHVMSEELFSREDALRTDVFLAHESGHSVRIRASDVMLFRGLDTAIIAVLKTAFDPSAPIEPVRINTSIQSGGFSARNIGFPDRAAKSVKFKYSIDKPDIRFNVGPWEQNGRVTQFVKWSIQAPDVKIDGVDSFILDYVSEAGFSGGPLVASDTNVVIGMISHVLPDSGSSVPTKTVAIHVGEILAQLRHFLKA